MSDVFSDDIVEVYLPFGEAVEKSARQNFERDVRDGTASGVEWHLCQKEYRSEARAQLKISGENFRPKYPHFEHYKLENHKP